MLFDVIVVVVAGTAVFCFAALSLAALADAASRARVDWVIAGHPKGWWRAGPAASVIPVLGWPVPILYFRCVRPDLDRHVT